LLNRALVPPSGGSLEIGNVSGIGPIFSCWFICSPFGGIPRNWKQAFNLAANVEDNSVPPSGGSLEIGNIVLVLGFVRFVSAGSPFGGIPRNWKRYTCLVMPTLLLVPPSGGSLEIGNGSGHSGGFLGFQVPPSGGSLEIGNS